MSTTSRTLPDGAHGCTADSKPGADIPGSPQAAPTRVTGAPVLIDEGSVKQFFETRSGRYDAGQPYVSILYQDRNPDLAARRDQAERQRALPLLALDGRQSLLDVGCGVGRWCDATLAQFTSYVGIDIDPGLINVARTRLEGTSATFHVAGADQLPDLTFGSLKFDRIILSGLLLYMNDDAVRACFAGIARHAAPDCLMYLREPLAVTDRLTLRDHWSDDLQAYYSAIYRTRSELADLIAVDLAAAGFTTPDFQPLYTETDLDNRVETRQFFSMLARGNPVRAGRGSP